MSAPPGGSTSSAFRTSKRFWSRSQSCRMCPMTSTSAPRSQGDLTEVPVEGLPDLRRRRRRSGSPSTGTSVRSPWLRGADVLVMGHILHDWDLDQKRLLVRKALDVLPPGGALIVYEAIIDDERRAN